MRPGPRSLTTVRASSDPLLEKPAAKPTTLPPREASSAPQQQSAGPSGGVVTIEYQRQQAKALQQYFRSLKFEEAVADSQVFGWTKKNEISNGRWVMMGLAVGLLTEYATAVNFVDQIKLMLSYLGIVDLDY
jgi:hypothetical protein